MLLIVATVIVSGSGVLIYKHFSAWTNNSAPPSASRAQPVTSAATHTRAQSQGQNATPTSPPPSAFPASANRGPGEPLEVGPPTKACETQLTTEIAVLSDGARELTQKLNASVQGLDGTPPGCGPRCNGYKQLLLQSRQQLMEKNYQLQQCRSSGAPTRKPVNAQMAKSDKKPALNPPKTGKVKDESIPAPDMSSADLGQLVDSVTDDAQAFAKGTDGNPNWPGPGLELWRKLLSVNKARGLSEDQSSRLATAIEAMLRDGFRFVEAPPASPTHPGVREVASELGHATAFLSAHQSQELDNIQAKSTRAN